MGPVPAGGGGGHGYGPVQVLRHVGLREWQWDRAAGLGLVPAQRPDRDDGRFSEAFAERVKAAAADVVAAVGDHPGYGVVRGAGLLAAATGLPVAPDDVRELVAAGLLVSVGEYEDAALYDTRVLRSPGEDVVDALRVVVAERLAWEAVSLTREQAVERLGWRWSEWDRVRAQWGLEPGRGGRFRVEDITALADDADLAEELRRDRALGPEQAAAHLDVRRVDFEHAVDAGWIAPAEHVERQVGRYKTVRVPLYRVGDVEDLRDLPGVDWEAVRAVPAGRPSALREFVRRPPTRASVVHAFAGRVADRFGVEAWAVYRSGPDRWEVDWTHNDDGAPTAAQVRELAAADPAVAALGKEVACGTESGRIARWARRMLAPGAACVLDTETTGLAPGSIVEIAVVDAATGRTLLDTLIRPGCPVEPGARWVHGITDDELDDAPTFGEVLPKLRRATAGRTVLAYNADFDAAFVLAEIGRLGTRPRPGHLGAPGTWACLMEQRSAWLGRSRWLPLGGGHRALGDARDARDLLGRMATPYGAKREN
ncbi:exonuclease domain-containing protein [Yinghuangia aomiensis]